MTATKEQQRLLDFLCEKYDLAEKAGNQIKQLEMIDRIILFDEDHPGIISKEKLEKIKQIGEEILKNL
jgi:hypothetical protein